MHTHAHTHTHTHTRARERKHEHLTVACPPGPATAVALHAMSFRRGIPFPPEMLDPVAPAGAPVGSDAYAAAMARQRRAAVVETPPALKLGGAARANEIAWTVRVCVGGGG
jgi:hypothetical protein